MRLPNTNSAVASLSFILWLTPLSTSTPFGTINGLLHQHAEHEMITRLALRCPDGEKSDGICFEPRSLDNLAGSPGFNGAVGSPDDLALLPEPAVAHCDDADFLNIVGYPQSRAAATAALQACVNHLRMRFRQGIRGAGRMLDTNGELRSSEVDILNFGNCGFNHRETTDNMLDRAKCVALEGLGRALHGAEDFYSHSNWADQADTGRVISVLNPPGLDRRDLAPFLDLRATNNISGQVPLDLTTGCFNEIELLPGNGGTGSLGCRNRIIHQNLNKDHGVITLTGTITADPVGVPREAVRGNFDRAVLSAIADARERWKNFRDEIKFQYPADKASLLICAIVRDDPAKDCRNRKISIVVDSSGSNTWTDPSNLRIQAAKDFNEKLTTAAEAGPGVFPDKVAVIDFDDSARILYPMGDPAGAANTFDSIDSSGGTNIGTGISLGIDEIMKDEPGLFAKRSGIIVLTDGEDFSPANQVFQLARARLQGIRVNYGFLSPPTAPVTKRSLQKRDPDPSVVAAILSTGGTFGIIESAKAQKNFINLVIARGATDIDSPVGSTALTSGVTVTEHVTPEKNSHDFIYTASAGEHLNFTITIVRGTEGLSCVLRNVRENIEIQTVTPAAGTPSAISFDASVRTELELIVSGAGNVSSEVIFSVGMNTNMPEKNETTTSSSIMPSTTSSTFSTSSALNTTSSTIASSSGNITTSSVFNTTHTSGFTSTAWSSTNGSWVYPHPTSTSHVAYPTGTGYITKVYTSVGPTKVVTTVCDGSETRVVTIYPTSRSTTIITTETQAYTTTTKPYDSFYTGVSYKPAYGISEGYKGSSPQSYSPEEYQDQYNKYVSSAVESLKHEYSASADYSSAPGYAEVTAARYGEAHTSSAPAIVTDKYGSTLPILPPASTAYFSPHSHIHPSVYGYGPGYGPKSVSQATATLASSPEYATSAPYNKVYSGAQYSATAAGTPEQPTSAPYAVYPGGPQSSPKTEGYVYPNATVSYGVGNATATGSTPVLYTGGARPRAVREVMGGVAGAIIAVVGLGIL